MEPFSVVVYDNFLVIFHLFVQNPIKDESDSRRPEGMENPIGQTVSLHGKIPVYLDIFTRGISVIRSLAAP